MPRFLVSVIASRLTWGIAIVSMLATLVWLYGPMLEMHGAHPLADSGPRLLLIVALYVLFALICVAINASRAWHSRRSLAPAPASAGGTAADSTSQQTARELRQSFVEASRLLRNADMGLLRAYDPRSWWPRLSRRYLYRRPWYLLIGAPGSGKTTLLARCGLHFPFADLFGQSARRKVGATRACDWWLTDAAVLLDTAGAYTTEHDPQGNPARSWGLLLMLLRKFRPHQPLSGVLLSIGMDDLLTASADERHEQARALHKRLQELYTRLRVRVPVYVVVTKADRLDGFVPYFDALDEEQRRQIWGFTFAHPATQAEGFELDTAFDQQHGLLLQRLEAGLPETLVALAHIDQRASAYLLPQAFARLGAPLRSYLDSVFSFSSFENRIVPRGVYFTSALHDGGEPAQMQRAADPLRDAAEPGSEESGAFFIGDVLEKVVFQEAGLAGSNPWWKYRNTALHWSGYALLGALLVLACVFWHSSYRNNHAYLDEVALRLAPIEAQGRQLDPLHRQDLFRLLPYLDALRQLPQSQQFAPDDPPLLYGLGLYQGELLREATGSVYRRALDTSLKPLVAAQIRDLLENDSGADPVYSYEALKAYRMLFDPQHYDAAFLRAWLMSNLRQRRATDDTPIQWNELDLHLQQLFDTSTFSAPFAEDPQLEQKTAGYLGRLPSSQRIYNRIQQILIEPSGRGSVSVVDLAGASAELVFKRPSGKSLVDGIPAMFTRDGYWQSFDKQLVSVAREMGKQDAWVIGTTAQPSGEKDVIDAVRQLYLQDYIAHWDGLLNDLALQDMSSLNQRIQTARLLSAPDSPMRRLLVNAVRHLQLAKNNEGDAAKPASSVLESRFPGTGPDDAFGQPEQLVATHYGPLIELARSDHAPGGGIAFDGVMKETGDLYSFLLTMQGAVNSGMSPPSSDVIAALQASSERLPAPFRPMLRSLALGASSDTQSSERGNIRKRVDAEVAGFCRRAIAGRYPLMRTATQDIAADDFGRMFAPGSGLMDSFFQQNLLGKVDTSGARWRFNPGVDGRASSGGDGLLRPFQQAQDIRDTFFGRSGARTPSFNVTLKPVSMDSDIVNLSLDVDGQTLQYSHGPLVPQVVSWPGPKNSMRVGLQLSLFNGGSASLWTSGDWALHRLLDKASIADGGTGRSRLATFNIDGHWVTLEIIPNSVRDPFLPASFACS